MKVKIKLSMLLIIVTVFALSLSVLHLGQPLQTKADAITTNIALGRPVTVTGGTPATGSGTEGRLTDGITAYVSSPNNQLASFQHAVTASQDQVASFVIDLQGYYSITSMVIFFRGTSANDYIPEKFTLDVWTESGTWETVITENNFSYEILAGNPRKEWSFSAVIASKVRIYATRVGTGNSGKSMQLVEMEVYGINDVEIGDVLAAQPFSITATIYETDSYGIMWHTALAYVYAEPTIQYIKSSSEPIDSEEVVEIAASRFVGSYDYAISDRADAPKSLPERENIYKGVIESLDAKDKYYYRVGDKNEDIWSGWRCFTAAPTSNDAFTFFQMSDIQLGYTAWNTTLNSAFATYPDNGLIVNLGDITEYGYDENEWKNALAPEMLGTSLMTSIAGSFHESFGYELKEHFNINIPDSQTGKQGFYYSYDYGNVHFVMLDVNEGGVVSTTSNQNMSQRQLDWLKADLAASNQTWTIIGAHWSPYSTGQRWNTSEIVNFRNALTPIVDEYGVDLVLGAHDHIYTRTKQLRGGAVVSGIHQTTLNGIAYEVNPSGTVFLTSKHAGGSDGYSYGGYPAANALAAKHGKPSGTMFTAFEVDENKLVLKAYAVAADGTTVLYDSYGIMKNDAPEEPPTATVTGITVFSFNQGDVKLYSTETTDLQLKAKLASLLSMKTVCSDGSSESISSNEYTLSITGSTVTVTHKLTNFKTTFTVAVTQRALVGIEIMSMPTKTVYIVGESLDTSGMIVKAMYNNGDSVVITDWTVDKSTLALGDNLVTVSYKDRTATFDIIVSNDTTAEKKPGCASSIINFGTGGAVLMILLFAAITLFIRRNRRMTKTKAIL